MYNLKGIIHRSDNGIVMSATVKLTLNALYGINVRDITVSMVTECINSRVGTYEKVTEDQIRRVMVKYAKDMAKGHRYFGMYKLIRLEKDSYTYGK